MKLVRNLSLSLPLFLFLGHQCLQKVLKINFSLIDNYLDPFSLGAIVPHLVLAEHRFFYAKQTLSYPELLIIFILLSVASEIIFPWLNDQFISDWFDTVAIFTGLLWFNLSSASFIKSFKFTN